MIIPCQKYDRKGLKNLKLVMAIQSIFVPGPAPPYTAAPALLKFCGFGSSTQYFSPQYLYPDFLCYKVAYKS
jgi:hypothetical protein